MEKDAAVKLGEPVLAGVLASSAGSAKSLIAGAAGQVVGGVVVNLAARAAAEKLGQKQAPSTPRGHRGLLYVAVGPTRLGFFSVKRGLLKCSLGDLLVAVPRTAVRSFEVGGGMTANPVTVELAGGAVYALEVPHAAKGKARKVQATLAA